MRIVLDDTVCEANGICMLAAPSVFALGDDDTLEILDPAPEEALRERVMAAVRGCPKQALSIE
jgi:ferredoxin